jgi:hypothetical protein
MINNDVFGRMKEVRVEKRYPSRTIFWIIGNALGFIPYLFTLSVKAFAAYFLWNIFLTPLGIPALTAASAFGLTSIVSILTIRYQGPSQLEGMIDIFIKSALLTTFALVISYLL